MVTSSARQHLLGIVRRAARQRRRASRAPSVTVPLLRSRAGYPKGDAVVIAPNGVRADGISAAFADVLEQLVHDGTLVLAVSMTNTVLVGEPPRSQKGNTDDLPICHPQR